MRTFDFGFSHKSRDASGAIIIEGCSNRNIPDRVNERLEPTGGVVDNYLKNPIVLFNHGKDVAFGYLPVGKALEVKAADDGLHTKIMISSSKTEKITAIRDLVDEGILCMFSIGFDRGREEKEPSGVVVVKTWELIEQSLVPIPMNPDSGFSVVAKHFQAKGNSFGQHYVQVHELKARGAWFAAAVNQKMYDTRDKAKVIRDVADLAKVKRTIVKAVLDGLIRPVPPRIVKAFSQVLRIDEQQLMTLDQINNCKGDSMADEQKPQMVVHQVLVPKDKYSEQEAAAQCVETHGYSAQAPEEDETHWKFAQTPAEEIDSSNARTMDLGGGLSAVIAPAAGAKAAPPPPPAEEPPAGEEPPPPPDEEKPKEDVAAALEDFQAEMSAVGQGETPAWATDTDLWGRAVEASNEAFGELNYGFVLWWYLQQSQASKSTSVSDTKAAMPSGDNATMGDDNPHLMAARQQNILTGSLIQEIQKMSSKLDGLAQLTLRLAVSESEEDEEAVVEPDENDAMKTLREIRQRTVDTDNKLKRLGV